MTGDLSCGWLLHLMKTDATQINHLNQIKPTMLIMGQPECYIHSGGNTLGEVKEKFYYLNSIMYILNTLKVKDEFFFKPQMTRYNHSEIKLNMKDVTPK